MLPSSAPMGSLPPWALRNLQTVVVMPCSIFLSGLPACRVPAGGGLEFDGLRLAHPQQFDDAC